MWTVVRRDKFAGLLYFNMLVCMLQMRIGNAQYQCSCVSYLTSESNFSLIIGLSVGLGVPLIIIAIIAFTVVFIYREKLFGQTGDSSDNTDTGQEDKKYSNRHRRSAASYSWGYETSPSGQTDGGEYVDQR